MPATGLTTLVLRVSNRIPGAWSGPLDEIIIGPRKAVEAETSGSLIADAFNTSGRLIFVVLFMALFMLTRSKLALAFSMTSIFLALRVSLTREMIFLRIFPSIEFHAFTRLYILSSVLSIIGVLCSLEAYLREGGSPAGELGPLGRAEFRGRDWILAALGATGLAAILYLSLAPDSSYLRYFEILLPLPCLCFVYYGWTIFSYARRRRVGLGVAGIYLLFFYYTTFEILCQVRIIDQEYMYPMFFLKGIPPLAGLATVQLQQGIVSYFDIAFLGFYFAYDVLRRRFPRQAEPIQPPARAEPRESRLDEFARLRGLSEREKEILEMAARGLSYERIAESCFISKHTVKTHLGNIYRKVEVKSKAELASKIASLM